VVEPLKVLALLWIAKGWLKAGILLLVLAYLVSFLDVDRIYHAGRESLLSIGWFAAVMAWLVALRETVLAPIRRSATYKAVVRAWRRIGSFLRLRLAVSSRWSKDAKTGEP